MCLLLMAITCAVNVNTILTQIKYSELQIQIFSVVVNNKPWYGSA